MTVKTAKRRLGRILAVTVGAVIAAWAAPSSGHAATFTPASVVSVQGTTLAGDAYQPVIDANGDAVVFVGDVNGVQGIWEKNLSSGGLTFVAGQSIVPSENAPDAGSPSVSANGQYIAFTTTADLDPTDDPGGGCSSVYVRNMSIPIGQPGAYTLASALNGSAQGLTYQGTADKSGDCQGGGSAAAYKVAISADGSEVAFTVIGQSDLTTGDPVQLTTPPTQVAVRYLNSDITALVSQTMASEQAGTTPAPVLDGAAMTNANAATATAEALITTQSSSSPPEPEPISASTAAISADGSTVAWDGINVPAQAPASSADPGGPTGLDEPLWRDIAAGPTAPTRRVTGGDDPSAPNGQGPFDETLPAYSAGTGISVGPFNGTMLSSQFGFGSFDSAASLGNALPLDEATPELSANGQEVAFLANAYLYGQVPQALNGAIPIGPTDIYVANMANGLTRSAALTQLTEAKSPVLDFAISADGTRVAFTTEDTTFPLASPALVTPALTQTETAQLYDVDLTAGTISLVSYGYDGNPANGGVEEPSFTGNGDTLAFASAADNLLYGAYNGDSLTIGNNTLVFTTTENTSPDIPGESSIGPGLQPLTVTPDWTMGASAVSNPNGTATLDLNLPGAGTITVSGAALIPIAKTVEVRKKVKVKVTARIKVKVPVKLSAVAGRREAKHGQKAKPKYKLETKTVTKLKTETKRVKQTRYSDETRTVLTASQTSSGPGPLTLTLTPSSAYVAALKSSAGLYTTLVVQFAASGEPTLSQTIQLKLHQTPPKPAVATPAKKKQKKSTKGTGPAKKSTKPKTSGKSGSKTKAPATAAHATTTKGKAR